MPASFCVVGLVRSRNCQYLPEAHLDGCRKPPLLHGDLPLPDEARREGDVLHCARWKSIHDLLILLRKAHAAGEEARVILKVGLDDLGLKFKKRYNPLNASREMIEGVLRRGSSRYTGSELRGNGATNVLHLRYLGLVRTSLMGTIGKALLYPFSVTSEVCAEHMFYALLQLEAHQEPHWHVGTTKATHGEEILRRGRG
ncbi:uncharacterized protein C8Q71DRAFT_907780 [Rhodofomes roseus]|uniref:Uncharacterized protein n=1 Tax=Rhodofomes roseus TaxID=34475 RepID=A0ABQ8KEU6_9APHY|nr:uncharacterized protein C8Q71DRAFT_907780 [Rhodofomes roseus]KAH9836149.1 hypothetical protein C8Q71DRAFT_907780 [Rhodofomes roseus]